MNLPEELLFRSIEAERDVDHLERFNASFTTDRIYRLEKTELSAAFVEEKVQTSLFKRYDVSGMRIALAESDFALLAEIEGKIVGFLIVKFESWNRRAWITHLYVRGKNKGKGIGSRFVDEAANFARVREARGLWLETQNFNYPAIQFYLKLGFRFCGFDESLYDPSVVPGETAIYFMRDL